MKYFAIKTVVALSSVIALGGCDLFKIDNYEAPTSQISGQLTFNGQPVGVRNGVVQLELWQPGFGLLSETQKMQVFAKHDGTFNATTFDGSYEINVLAGSYPWPAATARIPVALSGRAEGVNVPISPYYTIENPVITRVAPSAGSPGGAITATFRVGQNAATPLLDLVGVYIGHTTFVDQINSLSIANAVRQRTRAAIQTQLTNNADITITVPLPADIYLMPGTEVREYVFVRVGVKTVGLTELLFTQVQKIDL